jgi:hypothetical protein
MAQLVYRVVFSIQLETASKYASTLDEKCMNSLQNEARIDLTHLPCVCIDARKTAIRDDCIGIRPRAETGRRMDASASKWEMLVHIVDVSDIYLAKDGDVGALSRVKRAAGLRGTSRYDLPFGPLHFMPPRLLKSLSLSANRKAHRCVTLWVYIDERDGSIIDAGLERSVICSPHLLSYDEATYILGSTSVSNEMTPAQSQIRVILLTAERILEQWSKRNMKQSIPAFKREGRFIAKATESFGHRNISDDGRFGFARTRGHVFVDKFLDLHGAVLYNLIKLSGHLVPMAAGADISRGGRVATGPLRRFIDGEAQRQALAVLCDYGSIMSKFECMYIGKRANRARNSITNIRAIRKESNSRVSSQLRQGRRRVLSHEAPSVSLQPTMGKRNR